ncbi:tetraacyldisaccharide 4'-kinase [Leptospira langatensis]|uniref:Tetraacyldisaccharide 4'-kinase n=1 Tax=Leptospira langatensis TaxID=2484983 RepID=A0A5F1ZX53_9LEPT|nr:tetraacyldisaccharide 4'-kinase [Leptospira langatensis]TGK01317.1 tetraacyldisaccharide 4'-kinase [Leptospira langatensis]TGL42231.1 tetraacyldisaccharide 4'-kinase [Leptospira langatensis]
MLSLLRILFFPILYPLSLVYKILFYLDRSLKKKRTLPNAFTISVGNFSVGGTGKTPFTIHLANLLHSEFPKIPILILTRGYGSSGTGIRRVDLNSEPSQVGDEPYLLKKNLSFANVYVGSNRYESYLQYRKDEKLKENDIVFVLLDDGFQHHALTRDLDLVLLDCTRISHSDFTLPLGLLRESYSSVSRADVLVASKYEDRFEKELSSWISKYRPKQTLKFRFGSKELVPLSPSSKLKVTQLAGKSVYAIAGLGNPSAFWKSLSELGPSQLKTKAFPDHHSYTKEDIQIISTNAEGADLILCTEKDAVKISRILDPSKTSSKWFYLGLQTSLIQEKVLIELVKKKFPNR